MAARHEIFSASLFKAMNPKKKLTTALQHLLLLAVLALSGCGTTSFQRNPVVDEGVRFSLNKDASEILIYRKKDFRSAISTPNIFKIQDNVLVFDREVKVPEGTTSIIFGRNDQSYLISRFDGDQFSLNKINLKGDVVSKILTSKDIYYPVSEVADGDYIATKKSLDREMQLDLVAIKNNREKILLDLLRRGVNVIRDGVFDTQNTFSLYGEKFVTPIPPPLDRASNDCAGDAEITCFRVLDDIAQYSSLRTKKSRLSIASTLGNCQASVSVAKPVQEEVSRDGKTIVYIAITNPQNGDRSFFINHNPGKECTFSKMEVRSAQ